MQWLVSLLMVEFSRQKVSRAYSIVFCMDRYGKPVVLDMMEVNMFDTVSTRFNEIQEGLINSIMDMSFIEKRM